MHYNFLFNGCSFTFGGELQGPNNDLEHQRTHKFSHLVAERYNKTYDNISHPGVSNDWIVEKTIEWFEEGNTCDVAVIQFTDKSRTIWYDNHNKTAHKIKPYKIKKSIKNLTYHHIAKIYYKTFYSEILGTQNYYKNLFLLQNYFKDKNIKIVLMTLNISLEEYVSGWNRYCNQKQEIKSIMDIIGETHNFRKKSIENENYCPDLNQYNQQDQRYAYLSGTHPSEIGHQKIAQYIIDTIETLQ